jgi:undecaprenyl-diphosphatase
VHGPACHAGVIKPPHARRILDLHRRDPGEARPHCDNTLVAALSLGAAFALLTLAATSGSVSLDTRLIHALGAGRSLQLVPIMVAASWVASGAVAIPFAVLLALVLGRRSGRRTAWLYAVTCFSGWALNVLLKELIGRARPIGISPKLSTAGFYSFPSGHVMLAVLVFGFGALLLVRTVRRTGARRAIIGVAAIITLLVSVSRIYLGAHWPSDVLGGLLAGACWAATCVVAARRWDAAPA